MKTHLCYGYFFMVMVSGFVAIQGCKSGPFNLIKPASPHQQYERKIVSTGLDQTAMGAKWINNAKLSLQRAVAIKLPYQETGYFAADRVEAIAYRFKMSRGERITLQLTKKPAQDFRIYIDIWEPIENNDFKFIAAADTLTDMIRLDAEKTGDYVLRLQPELLSSGQFTLSLTTGPSLNYPLKTVNKNQIQSFYGDGRDENTRKHEGIDIFSTFRTPVIAAATGRVTRVNVNNLGGKVVWLRPDGKDYTLYYAHLDEQTVSEGQSVSVGDTIGRMGNTGNAKTTPPHLHLGIYTNEGPVDPLPYINPTIIAAPKINSSLNRLNTTVRTNRSLIFNGDNLRAGTVLRVAGAVSNDYRVELPDGTIGYLPEKYVSSTEKALKTLKLKDTYPVYDRPDSLAAVKSNLVTGQTVEVLGDFNGFQLVIDQNNEAGWILNNPRP